MSRLHGFCLVMLALVGLALVAIAHADPEVAHASVNPVCWRSSGHDVVVPIVDDVARPPRSDESRAGRMLPLR